jgi:hypothetical protein
MGFLMSRKTHEVTDISPIHVRGKDYWVVNMYWNTTLPEFEEFEDWCEKKGIDISPVYKISRIQTWELFAFGVKDETEALEFKIRWS